MGQISEYFAGKQEITLDELEEKLPRDDIQKIIYSDRVIIIKDTDGKIHFDYVGVNEKVEKKILEMRKELELPEVNNVISVSLKSIKDGQIVCQNMRLDEVPELSRYAKPIQKQE